ncbi:MAG: hypothetical protein HKN87_22300 [Saprospiraceae bacterium]|nr:hypothetical protein [Saprospiraceae bacterium]
MKDLFSSPYTVILLLSAMMVFSGCTVMGAVIGLSHNKARASETYSVSSFDHPEINKGNLVEIHGIDGRVLKGHFEGTEAIGSLDILLLKRQDKILKIRTTDIEKIQVIAQKKDGWIFVIIGIVIDGLIIGYARNNLEIIGL